MATSKTTSKAPKADLQVETLKHEGDTRKNIPTAEFQSVVQREHQQPVQVSYERGAPAGPLQAERNARNRDLDPQLVWRGKDQQDWSDLVVNAPPLYIQEKVHPKVLIDDLKRQTDKAKAASEPEQQGFTTDMFADMAKDFNGLPEGVDKTDFYKYDGDWSNRMILGDSLQVMASLAEREGLRGKVQCIYFDPPYGIKFNSNFQWSTTNRDVKDGNADHITREPEMVKAFRDTWKDGIHSYLSYIRDRLTVARDLLTESGSVFVQIGEENVHRVRMLLEEVFGDENYVSEIAYHATSGSTAEYLSNPKHYVLWFARNSASLKFRRLFVPRSFSLDDPGPWQIIEKDCHRSRLSDFLASGESIHAPGIRIARLGDATSQRQGRDAGDTSAMGFPFKYQGGIYRPSGTRALCRLVWNLTSKAAVD